MEDLLKPDFGLTFWTAVNFLVVVLLLAKFAWKPVIAALDERERKISADIENAKKANEEAQKIKEDVAARLEEIARQSAHKIKEAAALGEKEKQKIIDAAAEKSAALLDAARVQIKAESEKAAQELKKDMVDTAMLAVKKIIAKEADAKTAAQMVDDLLAEIKK